jgi:hypothetical protein
MVIEPINTHQHAHSCVDETSGVLHSRTFSVPPPPLSLLLVAPQVAICASGPLCVTAALVQRGLLGPDSKVAIITSQAGSAEWRFTQNAGVGGDYGHHMSRAACNIAGVCLSTIPFYYHARARVHLPYRHPPPHPLLSTSQYPFSFRPFSNSYFALAVHKPVTCGMLHLFCTLDCFNSFQAMRVFSRRRGSGRHGTSILIFLFFYFTFIFLLCFFYFSLGVTLEPRRFCGQVLLSEELKSKGIAVGLLQDSTRQT